MSQWAERAKAVGAMAFILLMVGTLTAYACAWWTHRDLWEFQDVLRVSACLSSQTTLDD